MEERLLTPEEVAARLSVSPKSIRKWLRTNKLRGVKAGRLWRVREDDLRSFLFRSAERTESAWETLSREEKRKRVNAIMGKYASVRFSTQDIAQSRLEEIEREERRSKEHWTE